MNYADNAKTAYANETGKYQQQAEKPSEMDAFTLMGINTQSVSVLVARVHALADRLTGTAPTPIQDGSGQKVQPPSPSSLLHALRITAEQVGHETEGAMMALDRIERSLP